LKNQVPTFHKRLGERTANFLPGPVEKSLVLPGRLPQKHLLRRKKKKTCLGSEEFPFFVMSKKKRRDRRGQGDVGKNRYETRADRLRLRSARKKDLIANQGETGCSFFMNLKKMSESQRGGRLKCCRCGQKIHR